MLARSVGIRTANVIHPSRVGPSPNQVFGRVIYRRVGRVRIGAEEFLDAAAKAVVTVRRHNRPGRAAGVFGDLDQPIPAVIGKMQPRPAIATGRPGGHIAA